MNEEQVAREESGVTKSTHAVFNRGAGTLILRPFNLTPTPEVIAYLQVNGYQPKQDSHITVIGFQNGRKLKNLTPAQLQEIATMVSTTRFGYSELPEGYAITKEYPPDPQKPGTEKEVRESVIQMVRVPNVTQFLQTVQERFGIQLEEPPLHITLATKGSNPKTHMTGVGISTRAELQALGRSIPVGGKVQ